MASPILVERRHCDGSECSCLAFGDWRDKMDRGAPANAGVQVQFTANQMASLLHTDQAQAELYLRAVKTGSVVFHEQVNLSALLKSSNEYSGRSGVLGDILKSFLGYSVQGGGDRSRGLSCQPLQIKRNCDSIGAFKLSYQNLKRWSQAQVI